MRWSFSAVAGAWEEAAPAWETLQREIRGDHPLFHVDFVGPLLEHFPSPTTRLARLESQGETLGLGLVEPHAGLQWNLYRPPQQPLGMLMLAPRAGEPGEALRLLLRSLPGWAIRLSLNNQDPTFGLDPRSIAGSDAEVLQHASTITVTLRGSHDDYWLSRSKKLRENVARYFRRIEKAGEAATFRVREDPPGIEAAFRDYCALECAGWKGQEGSALETDNVQGRFFGEVMRRFARRRQARVCEMYLGDRLVASRLVILGGEIAIFLKTTYAEDVAEFAPGRLLLYWVIRDSFSRRDARRLEFYTNATSDQLQWADESRPILHLNLYRGSALLSFVRWQRRLASDRTRAPESGSVESGSPT